MKAIAIAETGAEPALCDIPVPTPGEDEVLLRVEGSSINGFDLSVARGNLIGMMEHRFPVVLGKDVAGTVEAAGSAVRGIAVGDRMLGVVIKPYLGDGGLSEHVATPASFLTKLPAGVSVRVAGALGLAGTAAADAVRAISVNTGEKVLVVGATGGVGAIAIQLLKSQGATVVATAATGEGRAFVAGLGADSIVGHLGADRSELEDLRRSGLDAALHLAGDADLAAGLLKSGGRMASTLGFGPTASGRKDLAVTPIMANPTAHTLAWLVEEVAQGRLVVPVQREYELLDAPRAMKDFASGTLGKIAIRIA
jgi:NADPH:quinone reductase